MTATTLFAAGTTLFAAMLILITWVFAYQVEQLRRLSPEKDALWKPRKLLGEFTTFSLIVFLGAISSTILVGRAFDHVIDLETKIQKLEIDLKHYKDVAEGRGQVAMSPPMNAANDR